MGSFDKYNWNKNAKHSTNCAASDCIVLSYATVSYLTIAIIAPFNWLRLFLIQLVSNWIDTSGFLESCEETSNPIIVHNFVAGLVARRRIFHMKTIEIN